MTRESAQSAGIRAYGEVDLDVDEGVAEGIQVELVDWPGWRFSADVRTDGRLMGVSIHAPEGVSARDLRRLPLEGIRQAALEFASEELRKNEAALARAGIFMSPRLAAMNAEWASEFGAVRRPGRRGRDDRFYAEIAAEYVEALAKTGNRPIKLLADRRGLTRSQIQNLIYQARNRGLLSDPPRGRAGGQLTTKARRLL